MDGIEQKIRSFEASLKREAEKLGEMAEREDTLRRCVLDRNWAGLEGILRSVKALVAEIGAAEQQRNKLYEDIRKHYRAEPDEGFYEVLVRIPREYHDSLADLHRKLRSSVGRVQGATGGIDAYISAAAGTLEQILEELFPARRMRLYTRTGASRGTEHPLVVSHSL